jgi:hypothetical protein
VSLNIDKTEFMQLATKTSSLLDLNIMHRNKKVVNIYNTTFLGLTLDSTFTWKIHIDTAVPKLRSACYAIRQIKIFLLQESLKMVYYSYFYLIITYELIFWGNSYYSNIILVYKKLLELWIRDRD